MDPDPSGRVGVGGCVHIQACALQARGVRFPGTGVAMAVSHWHGFWESNLSPHWAVVAHTLNPSTWEAEACGFL